MAAMLVTWQQIADLSIAHDVLLVLAPIYTALYGRQAQSVCEPIAIL